MSNESSKEEKKRLAEEDRARRMMGVIPQHPQFFLDAGKRVETAWAWIPRLRAIIIGSSAVATLCLLGCLVSVFSRPDPMVFLSFPDGSIACGPRLNQQGQLIERTRDEQAVCDRLVPPLGIDMRAGNPTPPAPAATAASAPSASPSGSQE